MPGKRTPTERVCAHCGQRFEFYVSRTRHDRVRFCSRPCFWAAESHGHEERTCEMCGTTFMRPLRASDAKRARRFCSSDCHVTWMQRVWAKPWEERFWDKVNKTGDCWLWIGGTRRGYGDLQMEWDQNGRSGIHRPAHHLAWEMEDGNPVPSGLILGHTCDNGLCIRNDDAGVYIVAGKPLPRHGHLFVGTQAENMADMASKGRHPNAVLTPDLVREIRRRHANGEAGTAALVHEFGVSRSTIMHVLNRRTWWHIA